MMMPTCSLSRAARSTATLSFWKNNAAFRNLVTAPRSNHLSSSTGTGTAKNLNLGYKRSFSSNGRAPLPPTPRVPPPPPSKTWFQTFLAAKEIPPRNTPKWYLEMLLISTVFAITGSSTMMLVRPAVKDVLGLEGTFKDGPWAYRISSIVVMSPIYSVLLVVVGTVFGRHAYFRHFSVKMLSRFGIPPEMLDKTFHATKKNFRKW